MLDIISHCRTQPKDSFFMSSYEEAIYLSEYSLMSEYRTRLNEALKCTSHYITFSIQHTSVEKTTI